MKKPGQKRDFETRYWQDNRTKKPMTSGFPKAEAGSAKGIHRVIIHGLASKVQCVDRNTDEVLWTVKRGPRIPGTSIHAIETCKGDPDAWPRRRKEK